MVIDRNQGTTLKHAELAKRHGLKLLAYEGGAHLVGVNGAENNDKLTALFTAANRNPRMKDLYLRDLRNWQGAGGDLFVVFSSTARPSKWGNWGTLEYDAQDPATAPKYQAIRAWMAPP